MKDAENNFESAKKYFLDGLLSVENGNFSEAETLFLQALKIMPERVSILTNLSAVQIKLSKFDEAYKVALRSTEIEDHNAAAWLNVGLALFNLNESEGAMQAYNKALSLNPQYPEALLNVGVLFAGQRLFYEAIKKYEAVLELNNNNVEAWVNKGVALHELKQYPEALKNFDTAIGLNKDSVEAWLNKSNTLFEQGAFDTSLACVERAYHLRPEQELAIGELLKAKFKMCEWGGIEELIDKCCQDINHGRLASSPFPLIGFVDDPSAHLQAASLYVKKHFPTSKLTKTTFQVNAKVKIKIGYYSADFHNHATSYLMAQALEEHNSERFEIYAFSFGPVLKDDMRQRIKSLFYKFIEIGDLSDKEVVELSRSENIDIAVDLKGFTQYARTGIFAHKLAPLQINYLGYPGTLGAIYFDYVIADRALIPVDLQKFYSEKIVYLPNSYQANDARRKISNSTHNKVDLGLSAAGFVFCCFNNNYKILPNIFDIWMRILKSVEGSVLWLFEDNPFASRNLKLEAEKRGVDSSRLIFASKLPLDQHLARLRLADLFLDTLPYNAHTTASDALWAGLPLLTCPGKSFASRVAASLLHAVELPELVMDSLEAYEAKAIELAKDTSQLNAIKLKLEQNRKTSSLFDGKLFAQHLEMAYEAMFARYQAGLEPDVIDVGELIQQKG